MGAYLATYGTTRDAQATREDGQRFTLPRGSFVQWDGATDAAGAARVELTPTDGAGLATLDPSALQLVVTSSGDRPALDPRALIVIGTLAAAAAAAAYLVTKD